MRKLFLTVVTIIYLSGNIFAQKQMPGLDVLGYGYNVFGEYADQASKKKYCLFKYSNFKNEPIGSNQYSVPKYVFLENISKHKVSAVSGESMREYSKNQSASVGLSTDAMFFSGSINASFSKSESKTERYYYYTYRDANTKWRVSFDERNMGMLKTILDPIFKKDLATKDPAELFRLYGTHYIASAYLGGRADFNTKTVITGSTQTSDIAASVKASYGAVTGSASTSSGESSKKLDSNTSWKLTVTGGNSEFANNISDPVTYEKWASGIATMPVLCDFDQNSLKPIWDFCTTEKRKSQLKAEFAKMLKANPLPEAMSGAMNVSNKIYFIKNVADKNLYIDIPGYHFDAQRKNGSWVTVYVKNNYEAGLQGIDRFIKVIPHATEPDYVFLQPQHSNSVLNVKDKSKDAGAPIQLWTIGSANVGQMFKLIEVDGKKNTYFIQNKNSGLYLTSHGQNKQLTQEAITKAENQQWKFETAQASEMASVPTNRAFSIMNVEGKSYIDLAGSGKNAKTKDTHIKLWSKSDDPDRYSQLKKSNLDGYYYVQQMHSKYVWDLESGKKANGTKLQLWDQINKPQQQFKFEYAGSPMTFFIKNNGSNKYIEASKQAISQNGCPVQLWDKNGGKNQQWKIDMLPEWYSPKRMKVKIKSAYSEKFWDLAGDGSSVKKNGSKLQIWDMDGGIDRYYVIKQSGDYSWIWLELDGGKRITVAGGKTSTNRTPLNTWDRNNSDGQKFAIHPTGRYTCIIVTKGWKALDIEGGKINENGIRLILWDQHYGPSQQFKLIDAATKKPIDFSKL